MFLPVVQEVDPHLQRTILITSKFDNRLKARPDVTLLHFSDTSTSALFCAMSLVLLVADISG